MKRIIPIMIFLSLLCSVKTASADAPPEEGLLFRLSADNGFTADFAKGSGEPNFLANVEIVTDGAHGKAFRCAHNQLMSYWAPGNVYAQRGTLSFFWRSREPVGSVAFPLFRVGYSDHSSWDMVWLRIDYNGRGFDAFVTDANLARTRVSCEMRPFPRPDEWTHLALAWDENTGVRFYVNGALAGKKDTSAVYDAGLDQFGPHSRIISPYQVQSAYQFMRGGDVDEIRIYDRMLAGEDAARLARGELPIRLAPVPRKLSDEGVKREWEFRHGWNRPGDMPPRPGRAFTSVRKIGILEAFDHKQWFWKALDGIRETTWPGVYNRSRLAGRNDYFQLPDWNCYSVSGKTITFTLPDEAWNTIEISGAAWGHCAFREKDGDAFTPLFDRPPGRERTYHRLDRTRAGGQIRFENAVQETPMGEFSVFNVREGEPPRGTVELNYTIEPEAEPGYPCLKPVLDYISGRYPLDETQTAVALPKGASRTPRRASIADPLPVVRVLIPFDFRNPGPGGAVDNFSYTWKNIDAGLDGIALELPPMKIGAVPGAVIPFHVLISDPLWPARSMFDFSFSVESGKSAAFWFDLRDRMLPDDRALFMSIASADPAFNAACLKNARLRLVFKNRKEAAAEHEADRFTQARDNYGFIVEERPNSLKLKLFERLCLDLSDLLRVNPGHAQGRMIWSENNPEQGWPPFEQPAAPAGVPLWAFRQTEDLRLLRRFVNWWMDERQIGNGEFGGGLSDDGDLTNQFPGPALMGVDQDKIAASVFKEMEAFYDQGMFTNGLATILTDELHAVEDGISVLGQAALLDYGNPKVIERLMETARRYPDITDINAAGHRHFCSNLYSGGRVVREGVWQWSKPNSHLVLQPGMLLVDYNGNPVTKKLILELADGILAHQQTGPDGRITLPTDIYFPTDEARGSGVGRTITLFWAAWQWTRDPRYLSPVLDLFNAGTEERAEFLNADALGLLGLYETAGKRVASRVSPSTFNDFLRHAAWQATGDRRFLEALYADQIQWGSQHMDMMTEGHFWTDRVFMPSAELQRARLGGVALLRNRIYPGHAVGWQFAPPARAEDVAILVSRRTPESITVTVFNLADSPVRAEMTAWDVPPGRWSMKFGLDSNGDGSPDQNAEHRTLTMENGAGVPLVFPPRENWAAEFKLVKKAKPAWERPDLGIGKEDVKFEAADKILVRVHSLGSVDAPASALAIEDGDGRILSRSAVPPMPAPIDLYPKTNEVMLKIPPGTDPVRCRIVIDPENRIQEITRRNNSLKLCDILNKQQDVERQ